MSELERIGISLDSNLLSAFDKLIKKQGYENRSEAIRDLIRHNISEEKLKNPKADAVAAVLLVYDHHAARITEKLISLQHSHFLKTISSMHIHVNPRDCLEIIVLKGKVGEITKMAEKIVSIKNVKLGRVNLVAADKELR
jgi:CopG family nickel-responsive transcriptional regulator